jgi:hypothetical protein
MCRCRMSIGNRNYLKKILANVQDVSNDVIRPNSVRTVSERQKRTMLDLVVSITPRPRPRPTPSLPLQTPNTMPQPHLATHTAPEHQSNRPLKHSASKMTSPVLQQSVRAWAALAGELDQAHICRKVVGPQQAQSRVTMVLLEGNLSPCNSAMAAVERRWQFFLDARRVARGPRTCSQKRPSQVMVDNAFHFHCIVCMGGGFWTLPGLASQNCLAISTLLKWSRSALDAMAPDVVVPKAKRGASVCRFCERRPKHGCCAQCRAFLADSGADRQ